MRCIDCDFDLERISEPRCPECGRAFDPQDGGTFIGLGHARFSRRLAQAPGWPMFVLAGLLAILILRIDFGPAASFPAQLLALLASLAVGLAFIMRLFGAVLGHRTLPRHRPRIVPIALWRWLLPIALVVAAALKRGRSSFRLGRKELRPLFSGGGA